MPLRGRAQAPLVEEVAGGKENDLRDDHRPTRALPDHTGERQDDDQDPAKMATIPRAFMATSDRRGCRALLCPRRPFYHNAAVERRIFSVSRRSKVWRAREPTMRL